MRIWADVVWKLTPLSPGNIPQAKFPAFSLDFSRLMIYSIIFYLKSPECLYHTLKKLNKFKSLVRKKDGKKKCSVRKEIPFWPPVASNGWKKTKQRGTKFMSTIRFVFNSELVIVLAVLECLTERIFLNQNWLPTPLEIIFGLFWCHQTYNGFGCCD